MVAAVAIVVVVASHDLSNVSSADTRPRSVETTSLAGGTGVKRQLPRPGIRGDPKAPVLVLTDPASPAGDAICSAILATEGLPTCAAMDAGNLAPAFALGTYRVIVLADGAPLVAAQLRQVTEWVRRGGDLIALRPDDNLDHLLGLGRRTAILPDAYLAIDTSRAPGAGLDGSTLRYHTAADEHPLAGAQVVARLYSSILAATAFPAVTQHKFGAGTASAYAFDLADSVLRSRNGDPELIGRRTVSSDDEIRLADRFGHGYLDLARASIPQADELMHLLTHQLLQAAPLPRLWYLPSYLPQTHVGGLVRAAVVLTGDDHDEGNSHTLARFAAERAVSPANCVPADWTCLTSTVYAYPGAFSDQAALAFTQRGFEVAPHFSDDTKCVQSTTQAQLSQLAADDLISWQRSFPAVSAAQPPITERWHCYGDWRTDVGVPQSEAALGITADLSTACWPENAFNVSQCLLTGTQLPMQYADRNGRLTPVTQFTTVVTDENPDISSASAMAQLIRNAVGSSQFYGYLTALAHLDGLEASNQMAQTLTNLARSANIPVISARQAAQFWAGRAATKISTVGYSGTDLTFTVTNPVHNLELMVPVRNGVHRLRSISHDDVQLSYPTQTLDGVTYALVPAADAGTYLAHYGS